MSSPTLANQENLYNHYRLSSGLNVRQTGEAKTYEIDSPGVSAIVTVPDDVLEWFIDVTVDGRTVASDWCDYAGYDDTPEPELTEAMVDDIRRMLEVLLGCKHRVTKNGSRETLQSYIDGTWVQVVPLTGQI